MVAALVGFAAQVGTTIIAEGVETEAEMGWLRDAGVPLAQGYHFARPGPSWPVPVRAALTGGRHLAEERVALRLEGCRTAQEACTAVADELFAVGGVMPSVYLESAGRLRCRAQRGLWQVLDGMRVGAGITGRTFGTGFPVHVTDVQRDEGYLEAIPGVVAEYCAPVVAGGRVVGAVNVESRTALSEVTCDGVDRVAELLGRRLAQLPGEPLVPMRRLGRLVGSIFVHDDPADTARAVVVAACELAGCDSGAIVLGGERTRRVAATEGPLAAALAALGAEDLKRFHDLLEPLTSCYSSGEATGLAMQGGEAIRRAGAGAVLVVPLGAGDRRTGLLLLAHSGPLALGPDVIEPVELLAAVAGSCIENAEHLRVVERRSRQDPLTGLSNHAAFHEALRSRDGGAGFAVAMFDVDRFKQVNDTQGHLFGDRLLAATADALALCLPDDCTLYRVGGDEFAALLPARPGPDGGDDAVALLGTLLDAAGITLGPHGASLSVGLAWQGDGEDPIETLRRADEALYVAKASGGGMRRAAAPHTEEPVET